jgi:ABC-type multidrug transport system fused ATPase/permease subunit
MNTIQKFLDLLSPSEQKRGLLLLCMVVIMALLDVIGVASIMPFMAVLANPQLVQSNAVMNYFYTTLEFESEQNFLFALGMLVFILLVVSLSFKTLTTYTQTRFALMREYSIGKRLVEGYLHQPYSWFLNRHSADLGKTILSEVGNLVHGGMLPLMNLIAQSAVAFGLMLLLLLIDPWLAISVGLVLGAAYVIVFKLFSGGLNHLGEERVLANQKRYAAVSEAFGASKEVKVAGLEQTYTERFAKPAEIYAKGLTKVQVIVQLPRFVLEAIAFGGMLLVILYLMAESGSFANALPVISLYAFAGYRLLPALQQIYGSLTQLRFAGPALDALHNDLKSLGEFDLQTTQALPMKIQKGIELNQIEYTYPNAHQPSLKGVSFYIQANSTVGFVGSTGSGKTTTIDLILGLLEAQSGSFKVDGQIIDSDNRREWQRGIGYVPQQIYLSDDTVAANIAFGVDEKDIDLDAVKRAAIIANLHNFVANDLPQGYQTPVGERGVRLSGGQRQRIGVARALYRYPKVLILDEATSALDNLTEQAVMDAINKLGHKITIIIIAHRLSTIKTCDRIYLLQNGEVKAQGTYDELARNSEDFRMMAGGNQVD